jgi:hypothetical protein
MAFRARLKSGFQSVKEALASKEKTPIIQLKEALIARDEERALAVYCSTDAKGGSTLQLLVSHNVAAFCRILLAPRGAS